jgi:hypothetical protein
MDGTINVNGVLKIKRNGIFKNQECLYQKNGYCGDWCPQFGEPTASDSEFDATIQICQSRTLYFYKFTDERK